MILNHPSGLGLASPVATTLCRVSSPVLELSPSFFLKHMTFISFEEVSLNHSDFTF